MVADGQRAGKKVFLILDNLGVHHCKPVKAWLAERKEQRAGWYSGGFSLLTPDGDGEFSVALRSALLSGNTAELQAGAGIVAGSDARHELAETTAKLGTMLAALAPPMTQESDDSLRA